MVNEHSAQERRRSSRAATFLIVLAWAVLPAAGQTVYTYVGWITPNSVLLAWGATTGRGGANTIGRDSASMGKARVRIAGRTIETDRNWAVVTGLAPDTNYDYEIEVNDQRVGGAAVRTYPETSRRLTFFVFGDFGNGSSSQRAIAEAMTQEFQRRAQTENPVRFVLTVGDNVYSDLNLGYISLRSGSEDRDWDSKFFSPYREIIRRIPFYPTLGNHDGNASENRRDLQTYLDNFFFPENKPARWYDFTFGGLAHFFALDSTDNTTAGHLVPAFGPESEQTQWLSKALPASREPWKIPYFHHAPFNAGPGHGSSSQVLAHWLEMFRESGVKVVFSGHEHNFQISEESEATGNARYIVAGAGGELRRGNVTANMARAHIEGWAAQHHFLVVEIDGPTMRVTPLGAERISVRDRKGGEMPMPLTIRLP